MVGQWFRLHSAYQRINIDVHQGLYRRGLYRSARAERLLLGPAFGAALAGFLLALVARRAPLPMWAQEAVFVGFLGGYTTFSALSAETFLMIESRHHAAALAYSLGSCVTGVLAVWAGTALARSIA